MRRKRGILISMLCGAFFCFPALAATSAAGTPPATASYDPATGEVSSNEKDTTLPGGRIKMSGRYRMGFGATSEDFILNDANGDLQERNFRYLFGEELENTYDKGIYSQHLLNVDFSPKDRWNLYTQIVNDPWSWVGTTGEQITRSSIGSETMRYNLKYFGATNSTINEIYRTNQADSIAFPLIKVHDGHTTRQTVRGFFGFNPATGGIPFDIPELDIDYEYRPIRKLWVDYTEDEWRARVFALADQDQALSTDDPLGLSNHRDYWEQSPWLYQYKPIQFFSNNSVARGHYSDSLSYLARDSDGNRLVLLRGTAFEGNWDKTSLSATVAAPYTPWDEHFYKADNIPGAIRLKQQLTEEVMLGGTYGFRTGLIDDSVADFNQVHAIDTKIQIDEFTALSVEVAHSSRERDVMTNELIRDSDEGYAYKVALDSSCEREGGDTSAFHLSYAQMDQQFETTLSRYSNTRDDRFWGKHLTFEKIEPNMESFRIGDGLDRNRMVVHAQWREKMFKERFQNLMDVRNVHRASNTAYMETVIRDEVTYKISEKLTFKGMARWHGLPKTVDDVDPFISSFYIGNIADPSSLQLSNFDVIGGEDADRYTFSGALQYVIDDKWTAEGFYERTNDVPDFPRGLLNNTFLSASDRVDGILIDHVTPFLYGQTALGGVPPYDFFNIFRERVIYKHRENLRFIFHAAQNGYAFAGGIDDNITHEGLSMEYTHSDKLNFFFDYTHSRVADLPKLIDNNYSVLDVRDHHNIYASMDYKINSSTVLRSEYGVFGLGSNTPLVTPYTVNTFSLPTLDTEHLFRMSLTGDF